MGSAGPPGEARCMTPHPVLRLAAALGAAALVTGTSACGLTGGTPISTVDEVDFERPLAVPPLASSTVDADGVRVFSLTAQQGESSFDDGMHTTTWGFDGTHLGPTLRAARGERVRVEVTNALDETTTVHWHGMHLPAAMDGGPHQPIAPGGTWTPEWVVDQPAATLWYHPHPHGETEEHVSRGLAGLFLLDDGDASALPLPREYGVDDVPVIVQDARFDGEGEFERGQGDFVGPLGDRLLVNGTLGPFLDLTTEAVRLRLVNASPARVYDFAFADARVFDQIATDGGLLAAPHRTDHVRLSPGERAEIVVRMTAGERVVLRSRPPELGGTVPFGGSNGGGDSFDVLELRAAETLRPSPALPPALVPLADIPDLDRPSAERRFTLDSTQINGQNMDMSRIDEVVTLDTTEIWHVRNDMAMPHNFHVHDVQFRVLSVAGETPPPELGGWKDTVYLPPQVEFRLGLRFEDYADPAMPYMIHCHLLRHEDTGMMAQFVVVEKGQKPAMMIGENDEHHSH